MEGVLVAFIALVALLVVALALSRQRKRAAEMDLEDTSWLRTSAAPSQRDDVLRTAPVREFHVHGNEARVTFDVPLPDEEDRVLNELLVDEGVEVVREKKHTLPIDDVTEIVVFAGRDTVKEVGRTKLPSPGVLPPPIERELFNLTHVARDPFASQFETDHSVTVGTSMRVPEDELRPLRGELKVPLGIDRGLRARGIDPESISGADFLLALMELFGYKVVPQGEPGVYLASKDGVHTFIRTVSHRPGEHPELDEAVIRKFVVEFGTSGAQRGVLLSDKYAPFMAHDIEGKNPKLRFITRERAQAFIDSMALG